MASRRSDEATLVLIKPDAIRRRQAGAVLTRLESLGLELVGAKATRVSRNLAEAHYQHLRDKPFFPDLLRQLCGELHAVPYVLALVYAGPNAVARVRQAAGATDPAQADPASIRGALGRHAGSRIMENVMHASSDRAEADREIALWFRPEELLRPLRPTTAKAMRRAA